MTKWKDKTKINYLSVKKRLTTYLICNHSGNVGTSCPRLISRSVQIFGLSVRLINLQDKTILCCVNLSWCVKLVWLLEVFSVWQLCNRNRFWSIWVAELWMLRIPSSPQGNSPARCWALGTPAQTRTQLETPQRPPTLLKTEFIPFHLWKWAAFIWNVLLILAGLYVKENNLLRQISCERSSSTSGGSVQMGDTTKLSITAGLNTDVVTPDGSLGWEFPLDLRWREMLARLFSNGGQKIETKTELSALKAPSIFPSVQRWKANTPEQDKPHSVQLSHRRPNTSKSDNKALKRLKRSESYPRGSRVNKSPVVQK